jgi:hypothetical protein
MNDAGSDKTPADPAAGPIAIEASAFAAAESPVDESAKPPLHEAGTREHLQGFKEELASDEAVDRRLAEIEMIGEEAATKWSPLPGITISPEVRYLHISRTIHQLVTDRNRSVGIFLAVASILIAAATGLLNIKQEVVPIIPLPAIQYWCLPIAFATLAVLAVFISILLIRARIGLIYEVTKMNTLLGLHTKRVERVNPLSIFYIMHLLVVVLGGVSAGAWAAMVAYDWLDDGVIGVNMDAARRVGPPGFDYDLAMPDGGFWSGPRLAPAAFLGIGLAVTLLFVIGLQSLYYLMILRNTSDAKLETARR